jgi:hypothetical protein
VACWAASAKWGEAPALDDRRDMLLGLGLSEGLGVTALNCYKTAEMTPMAKMTADANKIKPPTAFSVSAGTFESK